jgi:hypothetical protein
LRRNSWWAGLVPAALFTLLGFAVMGYHPGIEDDGIYLTAIKADLSPALYPYNSCFFRLQSQATIFPVCMARFVALTGISLGWAVLFWQLVCLFGILLACHRIARYLFPEPPAQWAGVALVAAMFTLPVSGTALYMADQHLHPRTVATALILTAVSRMLEKRKWQAALLLLVAFLFHPIMAAMGISFCAFLALALLDPAPAWLRLPCRTKGTAAVALFPLSLGWIFEPANPLWGKALATRTYYFLYHWKWYEWFGALAPLALFLLFARVAQRRGRTRLARFALAVFAYGIFQQGVAMLMLATPALIRLTPLQPMRYLQLVYFFLMLMAGCLLGQYLLKASVWRWVMFLVVINGSMFAWQRVQFSGSAHLELPGRLCANPWLQAFSWIRGNTPLNAYFALDPYYLAARGEDYHGFRALAERSQLADAIKDTAVVTQVPELSATWNRQVEAQANWQRFQLADFERLKAEFGVDWVLVSYPQPTGLVCPWHNTTLAACQIP